MRTIFLQLLLARRTQLLARAGIFLLVFALMLTLTACAALDVFFVVPTSLPPTETALPTPTIVWFPPSATPAPPVMLTRAPTPEMRPNLGEILFTDDFSRASLWNLAASDQASASINKNRLNLAAQGNTYLISLRQAPILDNFYAEVTASPNLCRNGDSYGLLIRASAVAYYRFSLTCSGSAGAERVSGKSRQLLQQPIPSGDVPFGAGEVRIGMWAMGKEMRLFLNGRYQFSVTSPNYPSGSIGVFVNAAGNTPVVISFFNLTVRGIK